MQPSRLKTPHDLARTIQLHGIRAELVYPRHETPTVPLAAQAMNCQPEQIIKSVLFLVKAEPAATPVLVIANGVMHVDSRKLASALEVGRKRIRLANAEEVQQLTGFPAGGVPPFGFDQPILTLVHRAIETWPEVYGGGGDDRTLLRVTPDELLRVTGGRLIDAY